MTTEYYLKALGLAKERGDKRQEAEAYLGLGYAFNYNDQHDVAIEYYEKACKIAKDRKDKEQEVKVYLGLGDVYKSSNQFPTAIEHYQKALKIAEEREDKRQVIEVSLGLGVVYKLSNQFQTAIYYYEEVLKIAQEKENKQLETDAYFGLGDAFQLNNQIQKAINTFEEALKIAKEQEDNFHETEAHLWLGNTYKLNNQIQLAIDNYEKSLEIAKMRKDKRQETEAYFGLGHAHKVNGHIQLAIDYYGEALKISIEREDKRLETEAYLGLGDGYRLDDQIQLAIENYRKALNIAKERGDKRQETDAYLWLGNTYKLNNQIQLAIEQYEKALGIAKEQKDQRQETEAYIGLADAMKIAEKEGPEKQVKPVSWKWVESSIIHREKFIKLIEYGLKHPEEIKDVNGVRVCCSEEFRIGRGSDATRVYIGLGKDGYERAVKCLFRDNVSLAEQEKKVLNELNTTESNYVVKYRFLDDKSDRDWLFLIMDLCEETLKQFVERSSLDDLATNAQTIIEQVLKGLADLHHDPKPVLHRDLKPSNILRNVNDKWLLADFGISKILAQGQSTLRSNERGTKHWKAIESCSTNGKSDDNEVRYKKKSDIQVAGMVAFYIVTKGEHPFGQETDRDRNLLHGNAVYLNKLEDPAAKDLISWMLSHDPKDRPSAEEALKHPYLQSQKQQFEMLCKVGNENEIKTGDAKSDIVRMLNSNPKDWRSLVRKDILKYLCTDSSKTKGKFPNYSSSWTDCLRLIRNVKVHWNDRPRPRPETFYVVGDPQEYFLNLFPNLPVVVHEIVRSCDWKERPDLKEYFS